MLFDPFFFKSIVHFDFSRFLCKTSVVKGEGGTSLYLTLYKSNSDLLLSRIFGK